MELSHQDTSGGGSQGEIGGERRVKDICGNFFWRRVIFWGRGGKKLWGAYNQTWLTVS